MAYYCNSRLKSKRRAFILPTTSGKSGRRNPALIFEILTTKDITFWNSAPAVLDQLSSRFDNRRGHPDTSKLRLAFLSADDIRVGMPQQLVATFPNARFVDLGGATEVTVWSNYFLVKPEEVHDAWRSISSGKPIDNARFHILDGELKPCATANGDLKIVTEPVPALLAPGFALPITLCLVPPYIAWSWVRQRRGENVASIGFPVRLQMIQGCTGTAGAFGRSRGCIRSRDGGR